jgi:hypothetical protein
VSMEALEQIGEVRCDSVQDEGTCGAVAASRVVYSCDCRQPMSAFVCQPCLERLASGVTYCAVCGATAALAGLL